MSENVLTPPPAPGDEYQIFDFDETVEHREPPFLFEYNGTGFSTVGGIQALSGQKKNGKSVFISLLMAALLADGEEGGLYGQRFPGLRARQRTCQGLMRRKGRGHLVILYCDTEQEKENTSKVIRRAKWLASMPEYEHDERLHVQWMRWTPPDTPDVAALRMRALMWKIQQLRPDVVFIDGLRDLLHDFNDLEESANVIASLMSVATEYQACIWCVLHKNPSHSGSDIEKMRGHLGTELGNKVSDTFTIKKKRDQNGTTFRVHQEDARGKDVDDFDIEITDEGPTGLGIPRMVSANAPLETAKSNAKLSQAKAVFGGFAWTRKGATWTELRQYAQGRGISSDRKFRDYLEAVYAAGIITKKNNKYYKGTDETSTDDVFADNGDAPF